MKKFIFIALFGMLAMFVNAQTFNSVTSFTGVTVTNTQTVYLAVASPKSIVYDYAINIVVVPVNGTGTPTVTCMPQGSLDNSVWYDIQASPDTIDNAGTAASKFYNYSNAYWRYYRCKLVGSGTGVSSHTGSLLLKKYY